MLVFCMISCNKTTKSENVGLKEELIVLSESKLSNTEEIVRTLKKNSNFMKLRTVANDDREL